MPAEPEFEPVETRRPATMLDLLARLAAERAAKMEGEREIGRTREPAEPPGLPVKGCIARFIFFLIILGALAIGAMFLVLSGTIPVLVFDSPQQIQWAETTSAVFIGTGALLYRQAI